MKQTRKHYSNNEQGSSQKNRHQRFLLWTTIVTILYWSPFTRPYDKYGFGAVASETQLLNEVININQSNPDNKINDIENFFDNESMDSRQTELSEREDWCLTHPTFRCLRKKY